jgi:putative oxidoreductase
MVRRAGLEGAGQMMDNLELRPPKRNALASGIAETAGGALLALGVATPLAAALLNGTMFTAIRKVHLDKGPWNTQGDYEYNLVLIGALTALVETGPGRPSVDGERLRGTGWALAALAAGAAGSAAAVEVGKRAEPEPEPGRRFARARDRGGARRRRRDRLSARPPRGSFASTTASESWFPRASGSPGRICSRVRVCRSARREGERSRRWATDRHHQRA